MPLPNYHTHCRFCDGVGEPREYVMQAIVCGMPALGFSSHSPTPFGMSWSMAEEDLDEYCALIDRLRQEFAGRIEIYTGLEIDFIPGCVSPGSERFQQLNLDFCVGSVHVAAIDKNGTPWTVDSSAGEFGGGVKNNFGGDVRRVVKEYYSRVRQMVQHHCPAIVGHLDLIKKNNTGRRYFTEREDWYREEVFTTLDAVAESGAVLEVNTGGLSRGRADALYPSVWILQRCRELRIPLTISSDAHRPDQVDSYFRQALATVRETGYRELQVLRNGEWKAMKIY